MKKMILTKDISINKYRVLADYKVKVAKSPFMSVLQLAKDEGGMLNSEVLYEKLMKPLALKACENLLERLSLMGYFLEINDSYQLITLGLNAIENKEFYDKRNGLLEIWVAESNMFTQRIVKIVELKYDDDKKSKTQSVDYQVESLVNNKNVVQLNNGAFTLDKIEEQIKFLEEDEERMTIVLEEMNYKVELADFSQYIKEEKQKVIASILESEFNSNYLQQEHIVLTDFKKNNLSLVRDHKIESPVFKETYFNAITISNVTVSPKNSDEAKSWFQAKLKQGINKYFESDEEFSEYENRIANEFQLFKDELSNTISRQQLIELFGEEDFYKKAKLETIDYLSY
ncbi:hypothetical protein [Polaribacter sp.]|uniref:hypothetical protein n=1 Tax=Polaribacter sp. TaxID=1920175 RepID=UPI0035C86A06